jgi:hypothetical protein
MLCSLRSLLRFVQLQGACGGQLAQAVPHVANYGRRRTTEVFSEAQRRLFLSAFSRTNPRGRRDYAIALCLLDLGLRADEVTRLRATAPASPPRITVPSASCTSNGAAGRGNVSSAKRAFGPVLDRFAGCTHDTKVGYFTPARFAYAFCVSPLS